MPFKSEAQRRKFYELHAQGKISTETLREFESASEGKSLPERVNDTKHPALRKKKKHK